MLQLIAKKKVGALGRLLLPSEVRKLSGLQPGADIGIYLNEDRQIVLIPLEEKTVCCFCNSPAIQSLNDKGICLNCTNQLNKGGSQSGN